MQTCRACRGRARQPALAEIAEMVKNSCYPTGNWTAPRSGNGSSPTIASGKHCALSPSPYSRRTGQTDERSNVSLRRAELPALAEAVSRKWWTSVWWSTCPQHCKSSARWPGIRMTGNWLSRSWPRNRSGNGYADIVIDNSTSLHALYERAAVLHDTLLARAASD